MGGKSKSTTVGYHYRPAFHVGLVGRQIDAFLEYRAADKTAWAGELTASGRIQIDAPDLFGGEKDQGGIVGPVDVMFGEPEQMPNPYLVAEFGPQTVAWRGMTTLAFCGGRFGAMNPYQQESAYKIRKIKAGWDGDWGEDPCWYPERAEIPLLDGAVTMHGPGWEYQIEHFSEPNTVWDNFEFPVDGWLQGGELPWDTNGMAGGEYWTPTRSNIWLRRRITVHGAGLTMNIGADNGCVVWINGVNVGASNPENLPIPNNQHNPVVYELGVAGTVDVVVKAYAEISIANEAGNEISLAFTGAPLVGINPAHLLYYIRTDREKGAEPVANINDASLRAAADRLYAEGFGLCQVVYDPQQDTPDSMTERICRIIGGSFERSLVDGQWYLDLARGDYDLESLPIMGDDDILEFRKQPTTLHGVTNSLSVRYFDPVRKETVITPAVRALGLIRMFGEIHETLDFPEIADASTAAKVADRELRARITPTETFEVSTRPRPELLALRRSQYFRLQAPKRGIADMVCIVGEKDTGSLRSGAIRWKVAQDIYGLPEATYIEVERGVDVRPPQAAAPVEAARAFEAPYIDVVANLPRAELEALPDDVGYLLGVAARPEHGLDYTMAVRPEGGEFAPVANGEWSPTATTAAAIPIGLEPIVVPLATVRGLDRVPLGSAVLMGEEILRLDAKQLDPPEVTLARGCADTVPWPHDAGARMWFLGEDMAVDTTEYAEGEEVDVKFLTNTGSQQLPLAAASTLPVTFGGRQARPYPPGMFRINGAPYPEEIAGGVAVSWAHRDRLLQSDQLIDAGNASIGPEPGTTYQVDCYLNGALEQSETGLTGDSTTWTPSSGGSARVELWAERDSLPSWQKNVHVFDVLGAAPWTPFDLESPPAVWLRDDSEHVPFEGRISVIRNNLGTLSDAEYVQNNNAWQPSFIENYLNGRRVIDWRGSHIMYCDDADVRDLFRNVAQALTVGVYWLEPASSALRSFMWWARGTSSASRVALTASDPAVAGGVPGAPIAGGRRQDADDFDGALSQTPREGQWVMAIGTLDFEGRVGRLYIDGTLDTEKENLWSSGGLTSDSRSNSVSIGANSSRSSYFIGQTAELMASSSIPTQEEIDKIFGYLAHRWGLTDNLPMDHPYKDTPPLQGVPTVPPVPTVQSLWLGAQK